MDFLAQAALSNAVVVSVLAPIVLVVNRLARRPALAHRLWLLLLIKLVTPPLIPLILSWPVNPPPQPEAGPAVSAARSESRPGTIAGAPAATEPASPRPRFLIVRSPNFLLVSPVSLRPRPGTSR